MGGTGIECVEVSYYQATCNLYTEYGIMQIRHTRMKMVFKVKNNDTKYQPTFRRYLIYTLKIHNELNVES